MNFRVKPIPWFVSDVIPRDFQQVISSVACHHDEIYESMGKRWQKYLDTGRNIFTNFLISEICSLCLKAIDFILNF